MPATIEAPGFWEIVRPEATANYVTNPSGEVGTAGWSTGLNSAISRVRGGRFGVFAFTLSATVAGANPFVGAAGAPGSTIWTGSAWLLPLGTSHGGTSIRLRVSDSVSLSADYVLPLSAPIGVWHYASVTLAMASGATPSIYVLDGRAWSAGCEVRFDGVQLEPLPYATTFCDGDEPGCAWAGAPHASISLRSALTRAGGRPVNLGTYGRVTTAQGVGMPPVANVIPEYGLLDGGSYQRSVAKPRTLTLTVAVKGGGRGAAGVSDLHTKRAGLLDLVRPDAAGANAPVLIRYTGQAGIREIKAVYDGGMEFAADPRMGAFEMVAMRFIAPDPFWRAPVDSANELTLNSALSVNYIARRAASGAWSTMGGGANGVVRKVIVGADGYIYACGGFTSIGGTAANRIARSLDGVTWTALGAGLSGGGGEALDMVWHPSGRIYVVGTFTFAGTTQTAGVAEWYTGTSTWSCLFGVGGGSSIDGLTTVGGAPATGNAIVLDAFGDLIIGGTFALIRGSTFTVSAQNIVRVNLSNLVLPSSQAAGSLGPSGSLAGGGLTNAGGYNTGAVRALAVDVNGIWIWAGGNFTQYTNTSTGTTVAGMGNVAVLQPSQPTASGWNWSTVGGGFAAQVLALHARGDGVYAGGEFTAPSRLAARWDGSAWVALGGGLTGNYLGAGYPSIAVRALATDYDGSVIAGGTFSSIYGGRLLPDALARWSSGAWAPVDINFGVAQDAVEVATICRHLDYSLILGLGAGGAATARVPTTSTITNAGNAPAYPIITFPTSAGALYTLVNWTTGEQFNFNLDIIGGEQITLDLTPGAKRFWSNVRGNLLHLLGAGSDLATFHLAPGPNTLAMFYSVPAAVAYLKWRDRYWSVDSVQS